MQLSISNVGGAAKNTPASKDYEARQNGKIIVKQGMTLSSLARSFHMSVEEFKKATGIKSNDIKVGQQIKVPTAKIEAGKGISSLAKAHGMTLKDFCKLNGIPENYTPKKGEVFYVFPKKTANKQTTSSKPKTTSTAQQSKKSAAKTPVKTNKTTTSKAATKPQKTPEQIADELEKFADDNVGGIGNEEFNKIFNQIDRKNVIPVIKAFEKKYDKSLINMISDEWWSGKNERKTAMTKIYDLVSEAKGNNDKNMRKAFVNELDEQFNSFGTVSTEKLDKMINGVANSSSKVTADTKITLGNGQNVTAGSLQRDAKNGAKKDKAYKDLKNTSVDRPLPNYNSETKKIEATTEVQHPTSNSGSLKGKVIILNPGHGGYQQDNGFFDAGTVWKVKNADGNTRPIEEWKVTKSYVDKMAAKLRAKGATVVIVQGAVKNGGMYKQEFIENMLDGKKGSNELKKLMTNTKKSDMIFLSVHADGVPEKPNNKKCSVKYTKPEDKLLADNIAKYVQTEFSLLTPKSEQQDLYVNNATGGISSSLIEVGNIACPTIQNALLSSSDQNKYADCVVKAIEATLLKR